MRGEADFLIREEERMRSERALDEASWIDITRYSAPETADPYFNDATTTGERRHIYDNSAEAASDLASAALHGLLTNAATPWMGLTVESDAIKRSDYAKPWLEAASKRMLAMYAHPLTKFLTATTGFYTELIDLGNACLYIDSRAGLRLPLFRHCEMASVVWDEDADQNLVTFKRRVAPPLWSVAERWYASLPKNLKALVDKKKDLHKPIELLHCVGPRESYSNRGLGDKRNMDFAAYWICRSERCVLEEGGFHEQPYVGTRWRVKGRKKYGRGCGHKALPDNATLQSSMKSTIVTAEQQYRPPLQGPSEGVMNKNGKVSLKGGAYNKVKPELLMQGAEIRPIKTGANLPIALEFNTDIRSRIERAYLRDLLQLIREPEATATQILELKEEQQRGMSPILARLQGEYLGPLVGRSFSVFQRMNGFYDMPPPQELWHQAPQPTFQSPAQRAQQLAHARGVVQAFESAASIITLDPSVVDEVDLHKTFRIVMETLAPAEVFETQERVKQKTKARAEAAQQHSAMEALKDLSTGGKNIAPLVKAAGDTAANGNQQAAA